MIYEKRTNRSVAEVCERLAAACARHQFGVLAVLDLKERMAAKGIALGRECRIVEVCNAAQAKTILDANMSISTAMPCRISVYEDQGGTTVSTIKPTAMLGMFGQRELGPVARDVENAMGRIIDEACA